MVELNTEPPTTVCLIIILRFWHVNPQNSFYTAKKSMLTVRVTFSPPASVVLFESLESTVFSGV